MTGIDYPTVTIGQHENLPVRWTLAAQIYLRRRGLNPGNVPALIAARFHPDGKPCVDPRCAAPDHTPNPSAEDNILKVFAAMVADTFVDLSKPGTASLDAAPSADYWATIAGPEDFPKMELAIWQAMGKALEARLKLQVVAPPKALAS